MSAKISFISKRKVGRDLTKSSVFYSQKINILIIMCLYHTIVYDICMFSVELEHLV